MGFLEPLYQTDCGLASFRGAGSRNLQRKYRGCRTAVDYAAESKVIVQSLQSYHFYITVYPAFLTGFFPGYFFTFSFPVFLSASGFVSLLIVPERKKESFALAGPTSS